MRSSTLFRPSTSARSGRRSRLVSVPVTGAAALALVLTGCGGDDALTTDVLEEEAGLVEEDTELLEEDAGEAAVLPGSFLVGDVAIPQLLTQADPQAALAELPDDPAVATLVPVFAVPTDEGFWIGDDQTQLWVQLVEPGESPVDVDPGDQVSFTGEIVENDDGFVEDLSLPADQAAALTDIGYHVEVPAGDVTTG